MPYMTYIDVLNNMNIYTDSLYVYAFMSLVYPYSLFGKTKQKCVSETYNKRGARECDFDRLNNDFGWKHLQCSFLNENTVYMILTAFCMNFFSYFIRAVSFVFISLSPTSRVKKFVFHFTAVCAKWTKTARRWWLNLYTGMPYDKLSL